MPCFDTAFLNEKRVKLEVWTLILGFVNIILTVYAAKPYYSDEAYLVIICACFVISMSYIILQLHGCVQIQTGNDWNTIKYFEMLFHIMAAAGLVWQSVQFLTATIRILNLHSYFILSLVSRFCAVFLGFVTGILYGIAAIMLLEIKPRDGTTTYCVLCV